MICSSMTFAKEMLSVKKTLEENGHSVFASQDTKLYSNNPHKKLDFNEELRIALRLDSLREGFEKIAESDAVIVLNYPKNGIDGYLGTSVLMEIGLAYYLKKTIYILNEIDRSQNYALEIALTKPIILNGDLSKIK